MRLLVHRRGNAMVREKIYEPALNGREPRYHPYHADLFDGQEVSCREKHFLEQEIAPDECASGLSVSGGRC